MSQPIPLAIDLTTATEQQVFDKIIEGLHAQGWRRSVDWITKCCYTTQRSGDTVHCAAGCLMKWPDASVVVREYESSSWHMLVLNEKVPVNHENLIIDAQQAHDRALGDGPDLIKAMTKLCLQYGLEWPKEVPRV